ncbi:hypothetical protein EMMF5_004717 [Cystobasidiomycetes sp. EMM_F5]
MSDDFCYTLDDPTASALKGVFGTGKERCNKNVARTSLIFRSIAEKCNVLDWFTTFSKKHGLDTMEWNLITNANTAIVHVDNLMDNIVNGFGLSQQAKNNTMDPVQLASTIMNGLLGIMMLAVPETMPLDMLLMIANSGVMTWYNAQTKTDPMAPGPLYEAAKSGRY